MLTDRWYVAVIIVLALAIFYALIKSNYLETELECMDKTGKNAKIFYARKVVLFVFTIGIVFILTMQLSPN